MAALPILERRTPSAQANRARANTFCRKCACHAEMTLACGRHESSELSSRIVSEYPTNHPRSNWIIETSDSP